MKEVYLVLAEQLRNFRIIFRLSRYEEKATYQSHYLGLLWQILNPLIQIAIYYLIFGLGMNGGREVNGDPFIVWMLCGIIPWFFISSSILGGSNSIYTQVNLVSKMKFPVSILPSINFVSNLSSYFPMLGFYLIIMIGIFDISPSLYWIQYIYYFFAMLLFLFAISILNATITTLVRDYHIALQSLIRVLFYISGGIWNIDNQNLPVWLVKILKLNPIYYIIEGFRDSFLNHIWFWNKGAYGLVFWCIVLMSLIVGCHVHLKFRNRFTDFI